jgi:hypothetical protein
MVCVYIYCPFENQLVSTLIFITLIFFFYCRSNMKFFKAIQKSVLQTYWSQFFFLILNEHVSDCTCMLFHIILSLLLSFQQHQLNTYISNGSNEYHARWISNKLSLWCMYISDNILFSFWNLYMHVDLFNYYNRKENCRCASAHFPFFFLLLSSRIIVKLSMPLNVSRWWWWLNNKKQKWCNTC